jgi:hypothetical protein
VAVDLGCSWNRTSKSCKEKRRKLAKGEIRNHSGPLDPRRQVAEIHTHRRIENQERREEDASKSPEMRSLDSGKKILNRRILERQEPLIWRGRILGCRGSKDLR